MIYNETTSGGAVCAGFGITNDTQVIITSINQIDVMLYQVKYRSQRVPPITFQVYLAGQPVGAPFVSDTGKGQVNLTIAPGTSPYLEIIDHGIPHYAAPGIITLNWRQIQNAEAYEIQLNESSVWTTL